MAKNKSLYVSDGFYSDLRLKEGENVSERIKVIVARYNALLSGQFDVDIIKKIEANEKRKKAEVKI